MTPRGALVASVLMAVSACSRHAEVREDAPTTLVASHAPRIPDGGIPIVASGQLGEDAGLVACVDRPNQQACIGPNDYPCDLEFWVPALAHDCQLQTGCQANGWLSVTLDDHGCFVSVGMTDRVPGFLACVLEQAGTYRCPCPAMTMNHFLGLGHDGCPEGGRPIQ